VRHVDRRGAVEAILFASTEPVTVAQVVDALEGQLDSPGALQILEELQESYEREGRGVQVERVAEGFRLVTRPAHGTFVRNFLQAQNLRKLSQAAVECLAIVAYRQPVTAAEIGALRGVESASVLKGLLEKKLIRIAGRKNVVGRPLLYASTKEFLLHFGLNSLDDLPSLRELDEVFREDIQQQSLFRNLPDLPEPQPEGAETPPISQEDPDGTP
jgi:segregation and condensation protein B